MGPASALRFEAALLAVVSVGLAGCLAAPPSDLIALHSESGGNHGGSGGDGATSASVGAGAGASPTSAAAGGGTQGSGGEANPPPQSEDGLLALYTFDEGSGTTVHDTSGVGDPVDLDIADAASVAWQTGSLEVIAPTIIASAGPAKKIIDGSMKTNTISVEAWITPATLDQGAAAPARVVTLSVDTGLRNFMLGQVAAQYYEFRLRSAESDDNGTPSLITLDGAGDVTTELTHVVYTRAYLPGVRNLYVNGALRNTDVLGGDFVNWDPTYQLALANEITLDRPWLGEIHRLAIYDRVLTAEEIEAKFAAGP